MSFPRAKIQRFNDVTSCAPAPGSYDPKYKDKVHGTVIERSERFNDPRNKPLPDSQISDSGRSPSLNNIAVFRTPLNPKKLKRALAPQQQKHVGANELEIGGSIPTSNIDALKCALIEKNELIKSLELQLELVKQHACEMRIGMHVKQEVDAYVDEQEVAQLSENRAIVPGLENVHLDSALELIEAQSKASEILALNQQLETRVKELDECAMIKDANVSHLTSRCLALEWKAYDCEQNLVELINTLTDLELNLQRDAKNLPLGIPAFTQHIYTAAESIRYSNYNAQTTMENVKVFLTNVSKSRQEMIKKLRETILERDELRLMDFGNQLTIVELSDEIAKKNLDSIADKRLYRVEIDKYKSKMESAQVECKKYKVGNENLFSSLNAVSERLHKCHVDIEHLTGVIAKQSSENAALVEKVSEQCAALEAHNEDMVCMEANHIQYIEKIRADLYTKVEVLRQEIVKQKQDCESDRKHKDAVFLKECDVLRAQVKDVSVMFTQVEKYNGELEKKVADLKSKLEETENCFDTYVKENKPLYNLDSVRHYSLKLRDEVLSEYKRYSNEMGAETIEDTKCIIEGVVEELTTENIVNDSLIMVACLMKLNTAEESHVPFIEPISRWYQEVDLLCTLMTKPTDSDVKQRIESQFRRYMFDLHVGLMKKRATMQLKNEMKIDKAKNMETEQQLAAEISVKNSEICTLYQSLCEHEATKDVLTNEVTELRNDVVRTSEAIAVWKKRYMEMKALVGPFRQQLTEFESERLALESKKEAADSEVKFVAQKYAEILGHQNHKQKIKHVAQMKQQNLELKERVTELEIKLRQKTKAMEKLKEELSASHVKEKNFKERVARTTVTVPLGENSPARPLHPNDIQED